MLAQARQLRHQHLIDLDALLTSLHVSATEEATAAHALPRRRRTTALDAASLSLVSLVDDFLVDQVLYKVVPLLHAEAPVADLLPIRMPLAVFGTERPAAVLA